MLAGKCGKPGRLPTAPYLGHSYRSKLLPAASGVSQKGRSKSYELWHSIRHWYELSPLYFPLNTLKPEVRYLILLIICSVPSCLVGVLITRFPPGCSALPWSPNIGLITDAPTYSSILFPGSSSPSQPPEQSPLWQFTSPINIPHPCTV